MQDIISNLKNALQQAEAGLEVAVGRLAKNDTERGDFKPSEVLALAIVREALAKPVTCLHKIQEPEADIWPCVNIDVDDSGKITNAKLYSPGLPAGNHDVYPVRVPYMDEHTEAWRACVDELEKAVPGFMSLGNMNGIECAVAAIRGLSERAKQQEPAAAEQAAWHAGLDEGREQAAPAAVAVPDLQDMLRELRIQIHKITVQLAPTSDCSGVWMAHDKMSAALAATPAADIGNPITGTAAPVVLPEPDAWLATPVMQSGRGTTTVFCSDKRMADQWDYGGHPEYGRMLVTGLFTEQQVRALLAQAATAAAPALPAEGAQTDLHAAIMNIPVNKAKLEHLGINERLQYKIGHRDARHDAAELAVVHASPQAQADARDALAWLEEFTCDLRCVSTSEDDYVWNVIEHHMAEPRERVIGWGQTAIAAVREAQAAQQGGTDGSQ